jgi:hypothetical protein
MPPAFVRTPDRAIVELKASEATGLLRVVLGVRITLDQVCSDWRRALGEVAAAGAGGRQAVRWVRAVPWRRGLVEARRVQALVATRQGRWKDAESSLTEGLALARRRLIPTAFQCQVHSATPWRAPGGTGRVDGMWRARHHDVDGPCTALWADYSVS